MGSKDGALGASAFGGASTTAVSVADILADPAGFLNQQVDLSGRLVETFPSGESLFDDGTGRMPMDFQAVGAAPELEVPLVVAGTVTPSVVGGFAVKISVISWQPAPSFDCDVLTEARARFTEPGYSFGNVVGLFLLYQGVPPGEKVLEITWDEHNASGDVEVLDIGQGNPTGDGLYEMDGVVSHEYDGVTGEATKSVRAVLRIVGREGGCARVRDVSVTPGEGPGSAGGGTLQVTIDEGSPIPSASVFAVRSKVTNPTFEDVRVALLFRTPEQSRLAEAAGEGCRALNNDFVVCEVDVPAQEKLTRVVRYQAPTVTANFSMGGAVGFVMGDFAPAVKYKITVTP